jgi:hypothetical protein
MASVTGSARYGAYLPALRFEMTGDLLRGLSRRQMRTVYDAALQVRRFTMWWSPIRHTSQPPAAPEMSVPRVVMGVKTGGNRPEHGAATPRCSGEPPILPSPVFAGAGGLLDATRAPRTESQQLTLVGRPVRAGQLGTNRPAMPHIARDDRRTHHHSGGSDSAHLVANPAPPKPSPHDATGV